jgi:predicted Zn-dependent peptidase
MKHSVREIELKNGARGLLIDVPGASVTSYELNFRAGEFLVPKNKWEVPHLMEHIVAGGANEYYPDRRIYQAELSKNGAENNAYTSYYSVSYVGEVADFEWQRVFDLLFKGLTKPLFLESEFKAEYGNIRDELTSYTNIHFRELSSELTKSFGLNTVSDRERVQLMKNVDRQDVIEHYRKTHHTSNLRFIVAGNLRGRRIELKRMLENIDLPKGKRFQLPVEKAIKPPKPIFIANQTVPNIYLILSTYYNDIIQIRDFDALVIARALLTDTLYSKIFGQARDRGLVYHVHSGNHISSKNTEWSLSAQVLAENAPALCEIILTEIKKVQNAIIDENDLEGAKQYALGSFQRSLQTVASVAAAYNRYFFDGYIEDIQSIPKRAKSITKMDVANAMRRLFSEGVGNIGVLGGTDSSLPQKLYGQLQPLWRL